MAVGFADQGDAPRRLPDKARSAVLTNLRSRRAEMPRGPDFSGPLTAT
jgi:hypothetical protein